MYSEQGQLDDCEEVLIRLWDSDPGHLLGRTQLGTCYLKRKEYQKAEEVFHGVLEEDPDHKMSLQNYGMKIIPTHTSP